jgi:hypothetical protein
VRHLIGTAAGWGGLPVEEASYVGVDPQLPVGFYDLTMHDVPVDAFWSVSVYNAAGYFEPNAEGRYTINSVTGVKGEDGAVTVHFTPPGFATEPNSIPLPEGWNYLIRLYRPRQEFTDGSWHVPDLVRRRDRDAELLQAQQTTEPSETTDAAAEPSEAPDAVRAVADDPDEAVAEAAEQGETTREGMEPLEGPDVETPEDARPPAGAGSAETHAPPATGPEEPYSEH